MKTKDDNQYQKKQVVEKGLKPMLSNTSMPPVKAPKEIKKSAIDDNVVEVENKVNDE